MLRFISLRVTFSAVLAAALLPAAAFAQSQDSQSVAEAARRAREHKKTAAKPARVVTNDDVKPAAPASSESIPGSSAQAPPDSAAGNPPAAQAPAGSSGAQEPKDEKSSKEIAALKEQIKQALNDLDLLQRQLSLEQDTYLSNPDYTHDTTGKAKVDGIKLQTGDKQQELDRLKARLAELQSSQSGSTATPPKS
jgi:hypothetical protein